MEMIVSGTSEVNSFSATLQAEHHFYLTHKQRQNETPLSLKALMFLCQNPGFRSTH